jgi:hypothetical protein
MVKIWQDILSSLLRPKKREDIEKNLFTLKRRRKLSKLLYTAHAQSVESLLTKNTPVPKSLELYLIVSFERKRSIICDILLDIHKAHPEFFSLDQYLRATKHVFSVITQYRWAEENVSFVIKVIICYLQMNLKFLSAEWLSEILIHHKMESDLIDEVIRAFSSPSLCQDILSTRLPTIQIQEDGEKSLDIQVLQEIFWREYPTMSTIFAPFTLDRFLWEDPLTLAKNEAKFQDYTLFMKASLLLAIEWTHLPQYKKSQYKSSIDSGKNIRSIIFWANLILKQKR